MEKNWGNCLILEPCTSLFLEQLIQKKKKIHKVKTFFLLRHSRQSIRTGLPCVRRLEIMICISIIVNMWSGQSRKSLRKMIVALHFKLYKLAWGHLVKLSFMINALSLYGMSVLLIG